MHACESTYCPYLCTKTREISANLSVKEKKVVMTLVLEILVVPHRTCRPGNSVAHLFSPGVDDTVGPVKMAGRHPHPSRREKFSPHRLTF